MTFQRGSPRKTARNDQIFDAVIAGRSFVAIGNSLDISHRRVGQVFWREAKQRYPEIVEQSRVDAGGERPDIEQVRTRIRGVLSGTK